MGEYLQHQIRTHARAQMEEAGVLSANGHFDYGNGYHASSYLDVLRLLETPSLVWRVAQDLVDVIPSNLTARAEIVAGPDTAGAILAHVVAGILDGRRPLSASPCRFAAFERHERHAWRVVPAYASSLDGRSILLVNDCRRAGGALEQCVALATQAGADVIGCAAVWEWPGTAEVTSAHVTLLCDWLRADGVPFAECPWCRAGHEPVATIRFTKPRHRQIQQLLPDSPLDIPVRFAL